MAHNSRKATAAIFVIAGAVASGCITHLLGVPDQQRQGAAVAIVTGQVAAAFESHKPLVIALIGESAGQLFLADHFISEGPGAWFFVVAPGTYWVAAFEDTNSDGKYDDEPALRLDRAAPISLTAGERSDGHVLTIPHYGRFDVRHAIDIGKLQARDYAAQQRLSLGALIKTDEVVHLSDPRFDRANADRGLWQYYDFLLEFGAGVYFLEEFDKRKIPVLFIHGMSGTPRDFELLVRSLDRRRFQPWVFYYPSGARLEVVGSVLTQVLVRLGARYPFRKLVVVAHSMGGLVARYSILQYQDLAESRSISTFVTISSPFGGMESAAKAVENSPIVVHSWRDVATGSSFLDDLFFDGDPSRNQRRRLPDDIPYHLMFGYQASSGGSSDGVVRVASQLRPEAQDEARMVRGYDEDHVSILRSPDVIAQVNTILAANAR